MGLASRFRAHPRTTSTVVVLVLLVALDGGVRVFGGRDLVVGDAGAQETAAGRGLVSERDDVDETTTTTSSTTSTTTSSTTSTTVAGAVDQPDGGTGGPAAAAAGASERAGLTNAAVLTDYTGPTTITGGTVVIENKRLTQRLEVRGGHVTVRNSQVRFADDDIMIRNTAGTLVIEHSDFDGMNSAAGVVAVDGPSVTIRWSRFVGLRQAADIGGNSTFEHNVVSQLEHSSSGGRVGLFIGMGSGITVRYNTFDVRGVGANNCITVQSVYDDVSDVLIAGNDLTGGSYGLEVRDKEAGNLSNIRVSDNRWHSGFDNGTHDVQPRAAVTAWSGNTVEGNALNL